MADIKKELNDIKNAVYGKEVRGSIHDGIKKINDEVEDATDLSESAKHQVENIQQQVNQLVVEGDSSVEAAQARVDAEGKSYPTLKARLDEKETEFSSQLAQNARLSNQYHDYLVSDLRPKGSRRTIVSFISDDGWDRDFEILKDLFQPLNVPVGMALIPNYPNQITDEHLEEALELGWDFASHTLNHNTLTELTDEEIHYELSESKRRLEERGLNVEYLVYPRNAHDARVRNIARQYYKFALGGGDQPVPYPADTYRIQRVALGSYWGHPDNSTLEWYKGKFDQAYENDQWIIYMLHAVHEDFDATQRQHVRDLVAYIKSKNVPIMTVTDAYKEMGNALSVGGENGEKFGITNAGDIFGSSRSRTATQMGYRSVASGGNSVALGIASRAAGSSDISIGNESESTSGNSVALGARSKATGRVTTAVGESSVAEGDHSIAIGYNSLSKGYRSVAYGWNTRATNSYSVALGAGSDSVALSGIAIGEGSTSIGQNSSAIGKSSRAAGSSDIAIGNESVANSGNSVALGARSSALASTTIAIGESSSAEGRQSIALGFNANSQGFRSVAIGWNSQATKDNQIVLGTNGSEVFIPSDAIYLRNHSRSRLYKLTINDEGQVVTEVADWL